MAKRRIPIGTGRAPKKAMGIDLPEPRATPNHLTDESRFAEMKRYVRFEADDQARLKRLGEVARPEFERIASVFYERAREHEGAHDVFVDEAQIQRLHKVQVAWLERLLNGPYDEAYAEASRRIGKVHVEVGLPQRYMFIGVTLFRQELYRVARERMPDEVASVQAAVGKILDIELALMNGAYRRALVARAERIEREARGKVFGAIERSGRRYLRAVEIAGAIIIGLDGAGGIQLFNDEAERVTGYVFEDVKGRSFRDVFLPIDDQEVFAGLWREAAEAETKVLLPFTCGLRVRSGKVRTVLGRLSRAPEEDEEGEVIIIVTGRDVTDERALAMRVRQTERLAAVGTLAAGLAHEIRNPLNGAQLHLTFIQRAMAKAGESNPDMEEAVGVVRGEIDRLSSLVNEFLDFARPTRIDRQPVVLQELVTRVSRLVDGDAKQSKLELDLPQSDLVAHVDAGKIEQVLLNLMRNAIDAAEENEGGTVVCAVYRRPREAVIEVRDDGPGFSAEAPIFDAFYSTKDSGTGMGLSICHRIVQDHGGYIRATSRPGETVFTVALPLQDPTASSA